MCWRARRVSEYTTICNINKTIWHHIQLLLCIGLLSFIQGLFSEVDIVPSITFSLIRKKNWGFTSLNYLICKISHFVTTKVKKLDTLYTIKHSKKLRVVLLRSQDGNPASKRLSRNLGCCGFTKGNKILKKCSLYTSAHHCAFLEFYVPLRNHLNPGSCSIFWTRDFNFCFSIRLPTLSFLELHMTSWNCTFHRI